MGQKSWEHTQRKFRYIEVCRRALQNLDPVFNISLPCQDSLSRPLFISFRKRNFKLFYLALGFYIGFLANTILKICNIVYTINQYIAVPDPDLEITGGRSSRPLDKGGGQPPQKIFPPFGPQFGLKISGAPPLDPPLYCKYIVYYKCILCGLWQNKMK